MAIITPALVSALFTGFRAEFQRVYGETPSHWDKVATLMPSTSKSNTYGWLGQFPQLVEWVGARVLKDMAAHVYGLDATYFLMARTFLGGRDKGSITELTLKEDGAWLPGLAKTSGGKGKAAKSAGKVVDLS